MKAIINTGTLTLEATGNTQEELFANIAEIQEIFAESACGLCGNTKLKFVRRVVGSDNYYEVVCTKPACHAKLTYGLRKTEKGKLFPHRKLIDKGPEKGKPNKNGSYGSHNGWTKYRGKAEEATQE